MPLCEGIERVTLDFTRPETFAAAVDAMAGIYLMRPPQIARVGRTLNLLGDAAAAEPESGTASSSRAGWLAGAAAAAFIVTRT